MIGMALASSSGRRGYRARSIEDNMVRGQQRHRRRRGSGGGARRRAARPPHRPGMRRPTLGWPGVCPTSRLPPSCFSRASNPRTQLALRTLAAALRAQR